MHLIKIRLPDDNLAVFDLQGKKRLKTGDDVISKAALFATCINGQWRRSGRNPGVNDAVALDDATLNEMPVAIDMAPGMIYKYEPQVQDDGETVALTRTARPKP